MTTQPAPFDIEADVVVLGTGGAGLTAALAAHDEGADVLVLEKSGMIGGTTAMSGGMLWVPLNHHESDAGVEDSEEEVVEYLDGLAPGMLDDDTLAAFLEQGPAMVRWFEKNTPVDLLLYPGFPDYQSEAAGAKRDGGRSLDNRVFAFAELGRWAIKVNPPKTGLPRRLSMVEDRFSPKLSDEELAERERRDCRAQGQALVGSLLKGLLDRSIPIRLESRARSLIREDGRVVGVVTEENGATLRVRARKGVIIATGGFEWNEQLVKTFLRGPMTAPVSVPENEGDGLLMALEVGASLGNMSNAWWQMSTKESSAHRGGKANYLLVQQERTKPGSILVNSSAKRFVNEASNYNALGKVLHNYDTDENDYPNLPYWLIIDSRFRSKYRYFTSRPGLPDPTWSVKADTIEELAALIGLDGEVLRDTVERFNADVRAGHDDEFGRGDAAFDNHWGDLEFEPPYCTLGVLDQPPYYAALMEAGVLGTSGGPRANGDAQVIDWSGTPIQGLYVCSNAMAAVTAGVYGGAGGTLGPGMTFGYIAGRHAAQQG
jgi:succinate dehydrogenase/fumarate reductase flavoprotein subunit